MRDRWFNRSRLALVALASFLLIQPGSLSQPASAAQYAAQSPAPTDFRADPDAATFAETIDQALAGLSGYASEAVLPSGIAVYNSSGFDASQLVVAQLVSDNPQWAQIPLTYEMVTYSWSQLNSVVTQLDGDAQYWANQGIDLSGWGVDASSNRVDVMEAVYHSGDDVALTAKYGNIILVDQQDMPFEGGSGSRGSDSQPWLGGDSITSGSTGCTSWFTTFDETDSYGTMLTAGHCGTGTWSTGGHTHGTVTSTSVHWTNGGTVDVERTANQGYQTNEVQASPGPSFRYVTGVASSIVEGPELCISGAVTGEACHAYVQDTDWTSTYDGKTIYHQVETFGYSATTEQCHKGDSGGPVYDNPSETGLSNVKAYGMFVAGHFGSGNGSYTCIFTPVDAVLDAFAVTLDVKTS